MRYLRLARRFAAASAQEELAHRANFYVHLLNSFLALATGVLGVMVLFGQVEELRGWDLPATLALLGVYLAVDAFRGLFFGPSLDALAGMEGEIWSGAFDFTLLRPVDVQFQASVRRWRPLALLDLALGVAVLVAAMAQPGQSIGLRELGLFLLALAAAITILYAILLAFAGLVFYSPGFMFTWIFDALFQMARYPVGLYPGWLRIALTWVAPVGLITTLPAQALSGGLAPGMLAGGLCVALGMFCGATILFRRGLRRYASASS
ncbi:MAG: ABC-2 family transporter protein [Anaerolineales bacterium]|nr:ABC-2 family transporter protein [Anaerolineales bacterium]